MTIDRRQFVKLTVILTSACMTGVAGAFAAACSSDDPTAPPATGGKDAATGADSSTPAKVEAGADAAKTDAGGGTYACRASISANHGHTIDVPVADLESTTPKTYAIMGTSPHSHNVTLDSDDFSALKSGISVKKTSDMGGTSHDHEVNILCATI